MANRKLTRKYYFSVDGETEQWYFQWLEDQINNAAAATRRVSLDCKKKDPLKNAKSLTVTQPTLVTHVFDYESHDTVHTTHFTDTLNRMKQAVNLGKRIIYRSGYSNFSFELWIVLHKADCFSHFAHRSQYLKPINQAYCEQFENLDEYKHEDNFKRILRKLSLQDVKNAISRAKIITDRNREYGYSLVNYKGFSYYRENPSLSIWESVSIILSDCGLNDVK